jgi:hypothetical protein
MEAKSNIKNSELTLKKKLEKYSFFAHSIKYRFEEHSSIRFDGTVSDCWLFQPEKSYQLWHEGVILFQAEGLLNVSFNTIIFETLDKRYTFVVEAEHTDGEEKISIDIDNEQHRITIKSELHAVEISTTELPSTDTECDLLSFVDFYDRIKMAVKSVPITVDKKYIDYIDKALISNSVDKKINISDSIKKQLKDALRLLILISYPTKSHLKKHFAIFSFPTLQIATGKEITASGYAVFFNPKTKYSLQDKVKKISPFFERWSLWFSADELLKLAYKKTTISAKTAIMSRNQSHVNGSHVLNRIACEGSTDEHFSDDLKLLCKYLQMRMDFIAQISTESPRWMDTACLSHQLMATFLKQRKILQYIARSEGLTSTEFKNGIRLKSKENENRLGFVMRFVKKEKNGTIKEIKPILNFTADDKNKIVFPERIPAAFPGGRIGWQAFYVILEGFIRNAAKHNYASLPENKKRDLDIVIDIIDDGNTFVYEDRGDQDKKGKPAYKVRLYTDISKNEQFEVDEKKTSTEKRWKNKVDELNDKLGEAFIDSSTGEMRKANWGLAELRICAGFLQQADIMDVGGDLNKKYKEPADRVVSVAEISLDKKKNNDIEKSEFYIPQSESPCFYYEFKILKPRIIGIEDKDKNIEQWKIKNKLVEEWNKIKEQRQTEGWELLHYETPDYKTQDRSFEYYVLGTDNDFGQNIVKVLTGEVDIKEVYGQLDYYPGRLFVVNDATIKTPKELEEEKDKHPLIKQLRKRVCILTEENFDKLQQCYTKGTTDKASFFLQQKWVEHLFVNVRGFNDGQGLKLYHYLNERRESDNFYTPATTPYQTKENKGEPKNEITLIEAKNKQKTYGFVFGRHFGVLEKDVTMKIRTFGIPKPRLKRGTADECVYQKDKLFYGEAMTGGCSYFYTAEDVFEKASKYTGQALLAKMNALDIVSDDYQSLRTLLRFAETALLRVVVVDERFQEQVANGDATTLTHICEQQVFAGYLDDKSLYTQSLPSQKMEEFGFVKVCIDEKGDCSSTLERTIRRDEGKENLSEIWQDAGNFDGEILIIHHGILDKWFDVQKDKGGKEEMLKKLIQCLKQRFQYVVITSGRGRPEGVPNCVRFLPVSSFESGPQSECYEKYPLVQQVLAIVTTK